MYTYICMYIYIYIYVYIYVCVYTYVSICARYFFLWMCIYICSMYVHTDTSGLVYLCVCVIRRGTLLQRDRADIGGGTFLPCLLEALWAETASNDSTRFIMHQTGPENFFILVNTCVMPAQKCHGPIHTAMIFQSSHSTRNSKLHVLILNPPHPKKKHQLSRQETPNSG